MRLHFYCRLAAFAGALAAAASPAFADGLRLITVNVEWRLDTDAPVSSSSALGAPAPAGSVGVSKRGAPSPGVKNGDRGATLSVTVAEDALGSATYHSATFGDLLVTVRPHVNANGSVFANVLVRRTFQSAKTEVSTSQNFQGPTPVLLGRTTFSPPFASPGAVYATASIESNFKDPFAPNPTLGSGEAK
ncbi:hypothetical protein CCAX7_25640 [Capsulimonas corticalis]|uniref:Uncharacterized protein n=1 Tax=Capsulimonas corticalis TaxID=2219043 RepID=A0A402CVS0_9BACT|nr:hypothetical protein [Capsulimonas corticalis]BDI30513.1 hypothetical protein CCAX7_25640 [Capsulimonas corticalis]